MAAATAANPKLVVFDKYDVLNLVKYYARDGIRTLTSYKSQLDYFIQDIKSENPKDADDKLMRVSKVQLLESNIEQIDVGVEEFELLSALDVFCNIMDAERLRTRLQVKRLVQENKWLKGELTELQKRLIKLEDSVVAAEAEKQHFQYVYKMRVMTRPGESGTNTVYIDEEDETDPEEEVPPKVKALHNLCIDYIREKRYEVAIPLLEENIGQIKAKQGENNNDIATLYSILAKVYKEQGNLNDALDYYNRCLTIREKVLGKEHNSVGIVLTNLAHVQYKKKNVKDAEKNALAALRIREKTLSKTHLDVALIHAHLGIYYIAMLRWVEAINHYKSALSIFEQNYDSTDVLLIKAQLNITKAYLKSKQPEKSAEMITILCQTYQKKNTNRTDNQNSIFTTLLRYRDGKEKDITAHYIMQEFGSFENVIDEELFNIMTEYFLLIKNTDIADIIKEWKDLSERSPGTVVRKSIRRKSKTGSVMSTASSKKDSSISGMMGFLKKAKKKKSTD